MRHELEICIQTVLLDIAVVAKVRLDMVLKLLEQNACRVELAAHRADLKRNTNKNIVKFDR